MSKISILAFLAFCLGLTTNFSLILAFTVFLNILGADHIPYYYVGLNLIAVWAGFIFFWKNPSGIRWLTLLSGSACLGFVIVSRQQVIESTGMIYAIYILSGLFNTYGFILYWNMVNEILTIRELKRYLGLLSGAGSIAAILSGVLIQPFLKNFSIPQCFLVSSLSALCMVLTLLYVRSAYTGKAPSRRKRPPVMVNTLYRHELLRLAALFIFLGALIRFFIDFQYTQSLEQIFSNKKEIASFVGWFNSGLRCVVFLWQLTVSTWFFRSFRLQTILAVLPTGSLILATFALFSESLYRMVIFQFMFLFLLNTFAQPALNVLMGAMDESIKSRARFLTEGILFCCAVLITAALILALKQNGADSSIFIFVIFACATIWLWLLSRVNEAYAESIYNNLFDTEPSVSPIDTQTVISELASDDPEVRSRAFTNFEMLEAGVAKTTLSALLQKVENPQTLGILIKLIGRTKVDEPWLDLILERLRETTEPRIKANLIEALAMTKNPKYLHFVIPSLGSSHNRIKANSILFVLKMASEDKQILSAMQELIGMLKSSQSKMRSSALAVLGELGLECFAKTIQEYMTDPDIDVRKSAITAAFKIPSAEHIPKLLEIRDKPENIEIRNLIERALTELREQIYLEVEKALIHYPNQQKEKAISCIRTLRKTGVLKLATQCLFKTSDHELGVKILEALSENRNQTDVLVLMEDCLVSDRFNPGPLLETYLYSESLRRRVREILIRLSLVEDKSFILDYLIEYLNQIEKNSEIHFIESIFFLVGLFGPGPEFTRQTLLTLRRGDDREIDMALELVEIRLLSPNLRAAFIGCIEKLRSHLPVLQ